MKKYLFALMLLAFASAFCLADDPVKAKDLLKWFPDTGYSTVSYSNTAAVNQYPLKKEYRFVFDNISNHSLEESLLPENIKNAILGKCTAVMTKFEIAAEPKKEGNLPVPEVHEHLVNNGERFSILILNDAASLVEAAAKSGNLTRIGAKLFKSPIYSLSAGSDKEKKEGFLWLSPDGVVILTETKEVLKSVAKTGMGRASSFLDQTDNSRIVNMSDDFGVEWRVRFISKEKEDRIEKLIDQGENYERVEALEKALEEDMVFEVLSFQLSEEIIKTKYMIYQDSETAEKNMKQYKKGIKDAGVSIRNDLAKEKKDLKQHDPGEEKLNKAVVKFVSLTLNDVADTLETQKITLDGDTVISQNTFGKKHYQIKKDIKDARVVMDKEIKTIVARAKAENGES